MWAALYGFGDGRSLAVCRDTSTDVWDVFSSARSDTGTGTGTGAGSGGGITKLFSFDQGGPLTTFID